MTSRHIDYDHEKEKQTAWVVKTGGPAAGGLTVRDYFAAKAMSGLFSENDCTLGAHDNYDNWVEHVSALAYKFADAMIKEREND